MITLSRLTEMLTYEPETGRLIWRLAPTPYHARLVGRQAGTIQWDGYRIIRLDGVAYYAARLAFFYVTGEWPKGQIDHINRQRDDNRWFNLRECSPAENSANQTRQKNNKSGHKGVCFHKASSRWRAYLRGRDLGFFEDKKDAVDAYQSAASKVFGEFYCPGEMAGRD